MHVGLGLPYGKSDGAGEMIGLFDLYYTRVRLGITIVRKFLRDLTIYGSHLSTCNFSCVELLLCPNYRHGDRRSVVYRNLHLTQSSPRYPPKNKTEMQLLSSLPHAT